MRKILLTATVFAAALVAAPALRMPQAEAANLAASTGTSGTASQARVIVKYKADSPQLRRPAASARAQALGQRLGLPMRAGREVGERSHVVFARGLDSTQLARRLAQEADVEYAVPDKRRRALAAPNDPYYLKGPPVSGATGGPDSGQWYLRAPKDDVVSAIDAEAAWNITLGKSSIVVAVLDTGVRFDHPDLKKVADGGALLPGYDMVGSDLDSKGNPTGTLHVANDGNGRDSDASDPGDWITADEDNDTDGFFYHCSEPEPSTGEYIGQDSSWHGTQIAGVIGALTDNDVGIASVARGVRVLPVRVLGKCGGYDSDILAGMRWSVGIDLDGLPHNANPAKVLNLSLGSVDDCSQAYEDAVHDVAAKGAVIVASAGNDEGHAVNTPANCAGVIAVAAVRHVGTKVGFSDIGSEVSLSAPGGNCVNTDGTEPCLYPIVTTSNSGTTRPVGNASGGSIYTDAFNASLGTSFSAPMVAGTAALMLTAQPALTPSEVRSKLRSSARAFPTSGGTAGIKQCVAPSVDADGNAVDQDECYCTTSTCGAGMLDAGAAVFSAEGVQARIQLLTPDPVSGTTITFSDAPSLLKAGHTITRRTWSISDSGGIVTSFVGATDDVTASVTPTGQGKFKVKLTEVDSTGVSSSATASVEVKEAEHDDDGGGGGGAVGWLWLVMLATALGALVALRRSRE